MAEEFFVVDDDNLDDAPLPEDDLAEAVGEADALRVELAALKDQALRYAADAENTRRRAEKEINDARAFAIQRFAGDLFEAADNLGRALQAAHSTSLAQHTEPAVKNLVLGIDMTEKALQTAFDRNGLKKIEPARGEKFDPHRHQAMLEQAADEVAPGAVVAVMQTGYELFGRVVRPALVSVTPKAGSGEGPAGATIDTKA